MPGSSESWLGTLINDMPVSPRSMEAGVSILAVVCTIPLAHCAKSAHQTGQYEVERVVPANVLSRVDHRISFRQLRDDPQQYVGRMGRTVMFSGVALGARRAQDGTEIQMLQVPTERGLSPSERKAKSEGRFLAVQSNGFLDPVVIEKDASLTVVGEVKGVKTKSLDEGEYRYPVLDVKQLIDSNDLKGGNGDGDDMRYDGYYSFPRGYSAPAPPPPPSSTPRLFRKE